MFYIFANHLDFWLTRRRQLDFVSAFCCDVLVEICEENPASCRYMIGKGRSEYSLVLHQNSTSGSFLFFFFKVTYNVKVHCIPEMSLGSTGSLGTYIYRRD